MRRDCSIDDCQKVAVSRGWCTKHYRRWQVTGDPLGLKRSIPDGYVTAPEMCKQAGVTYRQLDFWTANGWVPQGRTQQGSGQWRVLNPDEQRQIAEFAGLVNAGFLASALAGYDRPTIARLYSAVTEALDAAPITPA